MFTDIVFPRGNEKAFVEHASRLGVRELIFAYKSLDAARACVDGKAALFVDTPSKESAKKLCDAAARRGILSVVQSGSVLFNRFILEKTSASALVNVEFGHKPDHTHFRRSGLDQVLCRFAARGGKMLLCSMSRLLDAPDKPLILGRVAQNIVFCRKYKVVYSFVSFAHDPLEMKGMHDLKSLMRALG
jgi:hypothetical protein